MFRSISGCSLLLSTVLLFPQNSAADDPADSLVFYASFESEQAELAEGDRKLYTAETIERKKVVAGLPTNAAIVEGGLWGNCLRFNDVSDQVVLFRGEKNVPYRHSTFEMTVSFWLRVDPQRGLKPGYVDPLQITDKKWNDASLFVDFTKDDTPRHFRLGVFSNFQHWNPTGRKWDDVPDHDRPLIVQQKTPFGADRWTHVAATLAQVNSSKPDGVACLYVDGKLVGCLKRDLRLTWAMEDVAVMLGIQYIGDIDDLAIFDEALSESEVGQVYNRENGLKSLVTTVTQQP